MPSSSVDEGRARNPRSSNFIGPRKDAHPAKLPHTVDNLWRMITSPEIFSASLKEDIKMAFNWAEDVLDASGSGERPDFGFGTQANLIQEVTDQNTIACVSARIMKLSVEYFHAANWLTIESAASVNSSISTNYEDLSQELNVTEAPAPVTLESSSRYYTASEGTNRAHMTPRATFIDLHLYEVELKDITKCVSHIEEIFRNMLLQSNKPVQNIEESVRSIILQFSIGQWYNKERGGKSEMHKTNKLDDVKNTANAGEGKYGSRFALKARKPILLIAVRRCFERQRVNSLP